MSTQLKTSAMLGAELNAQHAPPRVIRVATQRAKAFAVDDGSGGGGATCAVAFDGRRPLQQHCHAGLRHVHRRLLRSCHVQSVDGVDAGGDARVCPRHHSASWPKV